VKLDPVTGNIKTQKYIEGKYQFPSKTMAISKHQKNQTIVFKQTGRMIGLEMYDFNKNLMWERVFSQEYILFAGALAVAPDGDIYFSAYSKSILDSYPYYTINVDSMYVYHLDSSGVVKTRYSFFIGIENAFPVEIHAADNNVMLIYQINNTLKYRIIASSQLSPEINLLINHSLTHHGQNYCFDNGNTKARLIGTIAGINRYLEINKTTLSTNYLGILPTPMNRINFTQMVDSNIIVYCGRSSSDRESISLYNTSLKDTIWTKTWPANGYSQALKCALDSNNNIYLMSQYDDDILVRSLSASDGSQHWQYSYAGAAGMGDGPMDILYDKHRKHIIVSGYETDSSNAKQVIIITLDTLGAVIGTIRKTGDMAGDNHPFCSNLLPDGSIWIGGNLNINPYGLAGFILEIDSSVVISKTKNNYTQSTQSKVYPNPFTTQTTLESGRTLHNARLLVFNTHGKIVKEIRHIEGNSIVLQRGNLPAGLYFVQVVEGNELISTQKIIIVN
jgi:hypothetical protein